jgi:hypothetical protein
VPASKGERLQNAQATPKFAQPLAKSRRDKRSSILHAGVKISDDWNLRRARRERPSRRAAEECDERAAL